MIQLELTDTFGGEANYSWVKRFQLKNDNLTIRQILKEARKEFDLGNIKLRKCIDTGDFIRYNLDSTCICLLINFN